MRRILFLLAASLLPLAACSDDSDSTGVPEDITGKYTLRTVEGHSLPYTAFEIPGEYKIVVDSGYVTLAGAGTFTAGLSTTETVAGESSSSTDVASGTYTQNGSGVLLDYGDGTTDNAQLSGTTMTMTSEGVTLVFRK